jgi:hypothetical protein
MEEQSKQGRFSLTTICITDLMVLEYCLRLVESSPLHS